MASSFKVQIPADIHCLSQLLQKLGYSLGPMKAAQIKEVVDVWYVPTGGVKRAQARLVRGETCVRDGHPRRLYLDLKVQMTSGVWRAVGDADYQSVGLQPPWEYDGASYTSPDGGSLVYYYRLLPGDRDRAIAEVEAAVAAFHRGE